MKPVVAGATHRNGEHYKNVASESEFAQPASTTINMYYIGEVLEEHAGAEVAKEVLDDLPPRSSDVIQVAPDNEVDALDDLPLRASDVIQVAAPDNDEVPSRAITQQCQQQQQRQPKAQEPEAKPPRKGHHEQWQRHSASSSTGNGTVPSRAMAMPTSTVPAAAMATLPAAALATPTVPAQAMAMEELLRKSHQAHRQRQRQQESGLLGGSILSIWIWLSNATKTKLHWQHGSGSKRVGQKELVEFGRTNWSCPIPATKHI